MKKRLTITVGIPAYNEEANIKNLLHSITTQNETNYRLLEIIVVSDKSNDKTEQLIKQCSKEDSRMKLFVNKKRLGQAQTQNKIVQRAKGTIIVLLNADLLLRGKNVIPELIAPLLEDSTVGMVCPKLVPTKGETLFEKIINYSVQFKNDLYEQWRGGNNLFTCRGAVRAFRKKFISKLHWPKVIGEDIYSYLACLNKGYKYIYQKNVLVWYKSPTNLHDHKRQSRRFFSNFSEMKKYFSKYLVRKEISFPIQLIIKKSLVYLIKNPLYFISYMVIVLLVQFSPSPKLSYVWEPSRSTKTGISLQLL